MNIANLFLILAQIITIIAIFVCIYQVSNKKNITYLSQFFYIATTIIICTLSVRLLAAFINHDYYFSYVFSNSSNDLSLPFLVSAFWAGHEGSFLLWLLFINIAGLIAYRSNNKESNLIALIILFLQFFFLMILIKNSPFNFLWEEWEKYPQVAQPGHMPVDGRGLNPLLINPWMIIHPPLLFLGYATGIIPFIYAIIYLFNNDEKMWLKRAYSWLLFSMIFLTSGIAFGAYWAYAVLGWGGYWGWDPVENSSLVPWLIGIALIHGFISQKKYGSLPRTNILLSLLYFVLIIGSTFLTRSGILANFSVHSFTDSGVTIYLLLMLLFFFIGPLIVFLLRNHKINSTRNNHQLLHEESVLHFSSTVFSILAIIILLCTLAPLLSQIFMINPASVQIPVYNKITQVFGLFIGLLFILHTFIKTKSFVNTTFLVVSGIVSVLTGVLINLGHTNTVLPYLLSVIAIQSILMYIFSVFKHFTITALPLLISHTGIAFMILGIITSSYHTIEYNITLKKDKQYTFDNTSLVFTGTNEQQDKLQFLMKRGIKKNSFSTVYTYNQRMQSYYKEPYIHSTFTHDLYIIPQQYIPGYNSVSYVTIVKGQKTTFSKLDLDFNGYENTHAHGHPHKLTAIIKINNRIMRPSISLEHSQPISENILIPGTDRYISLIHINRQTNSALFHITPGSSIAIPEDKIILHILVRRFIWMIWQGGIMVIVGFALPIVVKKIRNLLF